MIRVEHLTKRYGPRTAVHDVSFRVGRGEIVGFLGPNGAGKSTTLRMLTGFLSPSGGTIRVDGIDALARPIEAKRRIGYMPELCPLYPEMRVREYLRYRAELKGVASRDIVARIEASIQQASVQEAADRIIGQLSKGTRQRVGLADALVADPPILVLDEPTAGLDPNQIRQVRELVRSLAGKKTVLLSTHILPEVEATCDRVVIIDRGRVVIEGKPDELLRANAGRQQSGSVRVELRIPGDPGETRSIERARACLEAVEGVVEIDSIALKREGIVEAKLQTSGEANVSENVFHAVSKSGFVLRELQRGKNVTLEDVFEHLTTTDDAADAEPSFVDSDSDPNAESGSSEEAKS